MSDKVRLESRWYHKISDPMVIIFIVIILASVLTYIVPAGEFSKDITSGAAAVGTKFFHHLPNHGISLFGVFEAIPKGLESASEYLFIVFIAGGLFHLLDSSKALEHAIGTAVKHIGFKRKTLLIFSATYIYGIFGITVGYENNIALVPVALIISSALGLSRVVGVCIAIGGIGMGFALSPINPYTVGVAQKIAGLPLFSGAGLRAIMVIVALTILGFYIAKFIAPKEECQEGEALLSKDIEDYHMSFRDILIILVFTLGILVIAVCSILSGITKPDGQPMLGIPWYINQIAAVFLIISMLVAVICKYSPNQYVKLMMEGAAKVTPGALVIGLAAAIQVILKEGQIIDSIVYYLGDLLSYIPASVSAILMTLVQSVINFFIPGGSGQALATMPILIPVADMVEMKRQLMILAFQVGDGFTYMISPTAGGTLAMLALAKVSYVKWLKAILPFIIFMYIVSWLFILIAHYVNWS
ncbi:YfcC family protein [Francisella adeliensis]|uniref:C4-dicarboxylate ABC transporter n=1 Tax=Francisella adeliensis TaxID=2007306 RepID=A0A2Z4XWY0_9GAMM|nr:TIGR00366 family protein [Francisella adeliensis]AXA32943.1 C4-dicarboxylate ABC transporter [Francisella adeliensis]MBK2086177.1 YfcC family protein [Francisella adeliensis]MBK2096659.1 YfcC family protein [Francisella adeliensis]QIW11169.1 YfcC family protein [Francisella adeliensis]QIW13045.1 YfcC family protein [Francisella adeliensis]